MSLLSKLKDHFSKRSSEPNRIWALEQVMGRSIEDTLRHEDEVCVIVIINKKESVTKTFLVDDYYGDKEFTTKR